MKKYLPMLAVLASTTLLSLFVPTSVLAQDTPRNEEYTAQHDGGDRAEYLQELEHSDPLFYVPPVNETSSQAKANNTPTN